MKNFIEVPTYHGPTLINVKAIQAVIPYDDEGTKIWLLDGGLSSVDCNLPYQKFLDLLKEKE